MRHHKKPKNKQKTPQVHTQLPVTQIPREKSDWGKITLECQTTFFTMYQEPSSVLLHSARAWPMPQPTCSQQEPWWKVLVRQSLVTEWGIVSYCQGKIEGWDWSSGPGIQCVPFCQNQGKGYCFHLTAARPYSEKQAGLTSCLLAESIRKLFRILEQTRLLKMYMRACTWTSMPLATAKFHVTQHTEKRNHWT